MLNNLIFYRTIVYRIVSYLGCPKIRLYSSNYALRYVKDNISGVLVRSEHEKKYVVGAYGYSKNRIHMLRLPCRIAKKEENVIYKKKEYCLHVSTFTQKRKNVMSLIEAAIKFKFNLKIAGNPGTLNDRKPFYKIASEHDNVEILGPVSEDELLKLYDEAKVFALPSLDEGVGFVALEAASRGCNIVITSLGGPKEYYQGMAQIVNPYSIDSIGKGVLKAMSQPSNVDLKNLINNEYNLEENIHQLLEIYTKVLESFRKCPLLTSISIP